MQKIHDLLSQQMLGNEFRIWSSMVNIMVWQPSKTWCTGGSSVKIRYVWLDSKKPNRHFKNCSICQFKVPSATPKSPVPHRRQLIQHGITSWVFCLSICVSILILYRPPGAESSTVIIRHVLCCWLGWFLCRLLHCRQMTTAIPRGCQWARWRPGCACWAKGSPPMSSRCG